MCPSVKLVLFYDGYLRKNLIFNFIGKSLFVHLEMTQLVCLRPPLIALDKEILNRGGSVQQNSFLQTICQVYSDFLIIIGFAT